MKRKPKVFYHPIEGSAPLAAYWFPGPYGDAIEAVEGSGVYFQAPNGDLLGVQFDDVREKSDKQSLLTATGIRIVVGVKAGTVSLNVVSTKGKVA
jgi:hypothetical protein